MLNLWRLSLLRDLANLGTMAAVARAANLSRPAVSQHLAQLEREVGTVLFERNPSGVRLTDDGLRLAGHARELLAHVESVESSMEHARERVVGALRLTAFGSFAVSVAPGAIARLRREHAELAPAFVEHEPDEAIRGLLARQVDVAVVDDMVRAQASNPSLDHVELLEDEFFAALPTGHPLARRGELSMADLRNERWVINESAAAYHGFVLQACWDAGFTPDVVCSCRSSASALAFVASGWAVSVLPGLSSATAPAGVEFVPIAPKLKRRILAAVNRGSVQRPSIRAAIAALRAESLQVVGK